MTGETPDILTFELDQVTEHEHVTKIMERAEPQTRKKAESYLNTLKVTTTLDPEAPIENELSSKSTKNTFKATFGNIDKHDCVMIVILPFRVPDNLCHFAASELTMILDQHLKPGFEVQNTID